MMTKKFHNFADSLRYRNRIADETYTVDHGKGSKYESPEVRSFGSSIRSTPSYGTPGTSARSVQSS